MALKNSQYVEAGYAINRSAQDRLHRDQISSSTAASGPLEGGLRPGWRAGVKGSCNEISILMVHNEQNCLGGLGTILSEDLIAEVRHVCDCHEASVALSQDRVPRLVLTDTKLPDGSWEG